MGVLCFFFSQCVLTAGAQGVSVDGSCQVSPVDLQVFFFFSVFDVLLR